MDEYSYYNSQAEQSTEFIFSNVQSVMIPDQNNGSYPNGQVFFDLASISNSGKFMDWQNSYLTIPLVANLNMTTASVNPSENAFALSFKNGFHHLINSLTLEITNNGVVQNTNFSNLDINYKLLTTCSTEDERNFLPSINFAKDNADSINYVGAASAVGLGEYNNVIKNSLFSSVNGFGKSGFESNTGRLERMKNTSFDPVNATIGSGGSAFVNKNVCTTTGKNHVTLTGTTDITYYVIATIPLKIMHDIFRKLPLCKGIYARLNLSLNTQCSCAITLGGAGTSFTNYTTTSLYGTFPLMVSPLASSNGLVATTATALSATLGIGRSHSTATQFNHPTQTSCRIYARMCEMSPKNEEMYISSVPTKQILYNDILSFTSLSVPAGGQVSQILTNGVSRPRYLLIIPQLAGAVNGSATGTLGTGYSGGISVLGSPMNSPFSSSPGTTCPHALINNLNVMVSGQNIYQSSILYGYEEFLSEVRGSNSLNGGIPLGLSSGIISQAEWNAGYRVSYVDLSRRISQASDDVSRSIQVVFTNQSPVMMDYIYILAYEKSISISTSTGALII